MQEGVPPCKRSMAQEEHLQRNCGPWKEVTATGIKITRCAGHGRVGQNEDLVEQETPKRMAENRRWKYPERNNALET
jgi:hypothetical protein